MQTRLRLSPADHDRPLTLEQLTSAEAQEGFLYEIIHGRLFVSPLANLEHEELREWILNLLQQYARQRPDILRRAKSPARVFLPDETEGVTAPEPDVACYGEFPNPAPNHERRWQDISPLLVVEILSPDTQDKDLERNRRLYREVPSIREYWILDTRDGFTRPSLIVFRRRGPRWGRRITIAFGDTYSTDLLSGFTLLLDPGASEAPASP